MPEFQRVPGKLAFSGMDVHHPPDLLPDGRCPLLFNLQPDLLTGALTTRPPISPLATTPAAAPVHSIIRMNDSVPEAAVPFARFAGAGANFYAGDSGILAQIDMGFSGNPLAMVPYRPVQSPEAWLYTYDSGRQQRYKTDGTGQNIGIAAPAAAPDLARNQPLYKVIENAHSVSTWGPGSTVGAFPPPATLTPRIPAGTTIGVILYDSGSTGMACIAPANASNQYPWMTGGSMATLDSEDVVIEQSFPGNNSTTVLAIQYDSGSSGPCVIVPAIPLPGLARDMLVQLNGATNARVLSVTAGPDGSYSFRCSTGADTIAPGQTIVATPSFRAWTISTHTAGAAITGNAISFKFMASSGHGTTIDGQVLDLLGTHPWATPQDLSFVGNRPLQNEDYMHVSLAFVNPQNVIEIHFQLTVSDFVNHTPDQTWYYVVRPNDFQSSTTLGTTAAATLQAQLTALSSQISSGGVAGGVGESVPQPPYPSPESISNAAPVTTQSAIGDLAWTEVMFKLGDMTRIGSDPSVTLANINNLGIYVFIQGQDLTSVNGFETTILFGGWWVGGGYGPDCNFNSFGNQAPEIQWRYRYRNSLTGAKSTVSPETRNGEILRRQGMNLSAPNSSDPQTDMIDFERRGGTNPDWHYVLSVPQGAGPTTALDNVTESAAQIADPLEVKSYQPWPVTDVPRQGTALVVGTAVVWQSGDQFNPRWIRGTEVIIGGNTYSLYAPPSSATTLELAQNVSPPPGVYPFSIPEATIEGNPIYGAWLDEANNRVCAVGDPLNPGLMYFSNNDNPDGAADDGYIEITGPSEPLLNGFYMEGSNYVFTSSSLYRVESTPGAASPYAAYRLSGVEGMAGPWAFDAQRRRVFYYGPDGIYGYDFGPAAENLTADPLFPLFPHEGQPGRATIPGVPVSIAGQTIYPPNYGAASQLRVGYSESFVYATYQNVNNQTEALVYSLALKGWRKDTYTPNAALFVLEKGVPNPVLMVGGVDGNLHQVSLSGLSDSGGLIAWTLLGRVADAGDSRAVKQWGDWMMDYSGTFNWQVLWDNLLVFGAAGIASPQAQRAHVLLDLFTPPDTNDEPLIHYNFAPLLTGVGCPVYLYESQPSYLPLPELTTSRVTDWQSGGALRFNFFQGIRIHANTFGQSKVVQVQYDGYQVGPTITVNHNGEQTQAYSFGPVGDLVQGPFKAHMVRLVPLDDTPWDLFPDSAWISEPEPDPATYWISQPTALGQIGYVHGREVWVPYAAPSGGVISAVVDGVLTPIATLAPSGGASKKYFPMPPLKGLYWQLSASGAGLQIYENDLEFLVKSWGSTGPYQRVKPFGDTSGGAGRSGARI